MELLSPCTEFFDIRLSLQEARMAGSVPMEHVGSQGSSENGITVSGSFCLDECLWVNSLIISSGHSIF